MRVNLLGKGVREPGSSLAVGPLTPCPSPLLGEGLHRWRGVGDWCYGGYLDPSPPAPLPSWERDFAVGVVSGIAVTAGTWTPHPLPLSPPGRGASPLVWCTAVTWTPHPCP